MLFSLDIGNKQTKMISDKREVVFPSYFVEVGEYGNRNVLNVMKNDRPKTSDYSSTQDADFTYVWGPDMDVDTGRFITDTISFSGRYDSRPFRLLVDFALAELARDYKEARKGVLEVDVATGIPTDDYIRPEVAATIAKAFKGDHSVSIDGEALNIRVNNLYVVPQPVGTLVNEIADDDGNMQDSPLANANVGIVDVGGGTLLIDGFRKMDMDDQKRSQLPMGAYVLYEAIQKELIANGHDITEYEVERSVRAGTPRDRFYWTPDAAQTIEITDVVMRERRKYTRNVVNAIKRTFKGFGRMNAIIVTGGGANLLIESEFVEEIKIAIFVDNSEMANARGFYKYGLAYGGNE